jgi:hypothetical protein
MSDLPPITQKYGVDTTDFKAGIAAMNREIKVIESGFRASSAAMGDWGKSATGLELRAKALTEVISAQKQKVTALQTEYNRMASSGKSSAGALADMQVKINKATEELNKNEAELKQDQKALADLKSGANNAAAGMNQLEKETGTASTKMNGFKGVASGLGTSLGSVGGAISSLTLGMAKLAAGAALAVAGMAAAGVAAAVAFGASTIKPASDLAETVSKVNVVFGDAAGSVNAFGDNAARSLGMSKNEALGAAGTYGNLFRSMGMGNQASADMSTGIVQLAGDLASFNNMDTADVLDKLRAGLTGETEPLKALGVNISAAAVEHQALAMGLKKVNGELPAAAKAQATYALVMKQTTLAQGDFARTSGGLANQQRILGANFTNLKANIGTALLPVVERVTAALNQLLNSPGFQAGVKKMIDWIGGIATSFTQVIAKLQTGDLKAALDQIFGSGGAEKALAFKDSISGIGDKIGSLAGAFKSGGIGGLVKELFSGIDVGSMAGGIGEMIGGMLANMATKPAQLLSIGIKILTGLTTGLTAAIPTLLPMVMQLLNSLLGFITQSMPLLLTAGFQILTGLIMGIIPMLPMLLTTAMDILMGLVTGITQALPTLIPAAIQIILQLVLMLVQNLPMLIQAGMGLLIALINGIMAALPTLLLYAPQILQALIDAFFMFLPMLGTAALAILGAIANGIIVALPSLGVAVVQILGSLNTAFLSFWPKILDLGKQIVTGIYQGILNNTDFFYKGVLSFFKNLIDQVKNALGMHSPSKVFADIGGNIALGLGVGFGKEMRDVQRQITGAMTGLGEMSFSGVGGIGGNVQRNTTNETFMNYGTYIESLSPGSGGDSSNQARRW